MWCMRSGGHVQVHAHAHFMPRCRCVPRVRRLGLGAGLSSECADCGRPALHSARVRRAGPAPAGRARGRQCAPDQARGGLPAPGGAHRAPVPGRRGAAAGLELAVRAPPAPCGLHVPCAAPQGLAGLADVQGRREPAGSTCACVCARLGCSLSSTNNCQSQQERSLCNAQLCLHADVLTTARKRVSEPRTSA